MDKRGPQKDEREFYSVVKFACAFSIGLMTAFIYSVKQVNPTLRVEITVGTVVSFVLSAFVVWQVLRGIFGETNRGSQSESTRRRWLVWLGVALTVGTVGGFVFAMRNVASPKKMEVLQGTLLALFVLGMMGLALVKVMKFLEEDSERNLKGPDEENH